MQRAGLLVIGAVCLLGVSAGPRPGSRLGRNQLKIVGGHPVKIEDVPFQISLEKYSSHYCGGSILSRQWVLTSARCLHLDDDVTSYGVRYASDVREQGGTLLQVKWMASHDKYDVGLRNNDVAVVQVAEDIVYSAKAQPVRLPTVGVLPKSTDTLSVSGWGTEHYYDFDGPSELRAVTVPYVPRPTCRVSYEDQGRRIDGSMICAGMSDKDACQMDAGGPLVNGLGVQVGVVSWGIGCGAPGYAGVYANLACPVNRAWIRNTTSIG